MLSSVVFCNQILGQTSENLDPQLWLGLGGGVTHIVPHGFGTHKNGYHLLASASVEWLNPTWVLAFGGGFFYNRVYTGVERDFATEQPLVVREQRNLRIETRSGAAELASRYRLWGSKAEAGILLRNFFGSSLSFSQDKNSAASKFFIGPQLLIKSTENGEWMQRIDLSLTAALNVPHSQVFLLSLGVGIGKSWLETKAIITQAPIEPERIEEILADKVINFPSASSKLQEPALSFLKELGAFLNQHPEYWQEMNVEGHTDKKGKVAYNKQLSQDRADAVRLVILEQGVNQPKVTAHGFGPSKPLRDGDSPEILAINRRVVMVFRTNSREDRQKISGEIKLLRKKYFNE